MGGGRGAGPGQQILNCFPLSWGGRALHTPLPEAVAPAFTLLLSPHSRRCLRQVWGPWKPILWG